MDDLSSRLLQLCGGLVMSTYTISICECNYYQVTVHAESEEGAREEYELGLAYPNWDQKQNVLEPLNEHGTSMIVDVSRAYLRMDDDEPDEPYRPDDNHNPYTDE